MLQRRLGSPVAAAAMRCTTGIACSPAQAPAHYSTGAGDTLRSAEARCYISRCTDPYTNLAFEDWLLRNSDPRSYVLYLWRNRPTIVIGRNQNPWKECNLARMATRDVWLARRSSGGGAVYHDLGNTNYTVLMPRDAFTRDRCAQMVADALKGEDIPAYVNGRHDVTVDERKISGSAFKLTNKRAFHHGTMLIDADLDRLHGCLDNGGKLIEAKGVDSVRSAVANLRDYSWTIDHSTFCSAVMAEFSKTFGPLSQDNVVAWDGVPEGIEGERRRIQTWDWLYAQTPEFTHRFEPRRFNWAAEPIDSAITARRARITHVVFGAGTVVPPDVRGVMNMVSADLVDCLYDRQSIEACLAPRLSDHRIKDLCAWLVSEL